MEEDLADGQKTFAVKFQPQILDVILLPAQEVYITVSAAEQGGELVFYHQVLPGPASRSYGIEVAQLAGMPQQVVSRAKEVLASLQRHKEDV